MKSTPCKFYKHLKIEGILKFLRSQYSGNTLDIEYKSYSHQNSFGVFRQSTENRCASVMS